jgi:hypothetical protein
LPASARATLVDIAFLAVALCCVLALPPTLGAERAQKNA